MKKEKINIEKEKKILRVLIIAIIILTLLLIISKNFGSYEVVRLSKNNHEIFSISDLTINNIGFSTSEKEILKKMGKPQKEKKLKQDIYQYKVLYYDDLKLTLRENYNDYILVKVEITGKKYKINRDIKVGDSILSVMKKFRVDNSKGTYLYGNYSVNALNDVEITNNIYFGVRNSQEVVYINKDAVVDDMVSNIARLNISYSHGKVKKITWSYDFK